MTRIILSIFLCGAAVSVAAQGTPEGELSAVAEFELLAKIGVAIVTGIVALLGLPMIYLTYRKTSVEIRKLELESKQLMETSESPSSSSAGTDNGIRVQIIESPNSSVRVLADPRFLAPLLVLLDFIFAWVILTLASYLLRIFDLGELGAIILLLLALFLLLPLAHQVMKIRSAMQATDLSDQGPLVRQLTMIATISYSLAAILSLGFGGLIIYFDLTNNGNITLLGRYFGWGLIIVGVAMMIAASWARKKLDEYLHSF